MMKNILFLYCFFFLNITVFAQVGVGTIDPKSTLDINGNLSVKHLTLTGSGTATDINDGVYLSVDPQATDQEFRLPNPISFPGRVYIIRNINNVNTAQLTTTSGLLFPKGSTIGSSQVYMYENNLRTIIVISDGFNWTYMD
ncbi:hypothetical protein Q4512_00785 [Oceanihabitans sp. 2_MG-2023]|uniref:hypothetical protein n=1 Tax=Oceanihabitans sp. 2_MG-2023 TaxID=3062661 RepID=UPI0026E2CFDD|nr:hypothetical protein [Oceanihabitans sp. 2_MG-2023]MDO6595426.1 hypothetical protein [Oceanihabitans sp. 2_MG-2023]